MNSQQKPLPPGPPLVRFSLGRIFLFIGGVSGLLAILTAVNGYWTVVILVAVMIVISHVVATLLGSRLRQHAEQRRRWHARQGGADPDEAASRVAPKPFGELDLPPVSPLGNRSTRMPWLWLSMALGAILAAFGGATLLVKTVGDRATIAGLALGIFSAAMLGAWMVFVASGFVGIFQHAWSDAVSHHRKDSEKAKRK
jgi:membrane protein implicated in regulation of membrane protease activity